MTRHGKGNYNYTVLLYSACLDQGVWSGKKLQLIGWELLLQCKFLHTHSEVFISWIHYCWWTWIPGFSEIFSNCQHDLLWSFWILPEWLTGHKPYSSLHRVWAIIDLTKDMYTVLFIMFSMITNIYNKKTKGSTLMELFTATGKLKKFFWQLEMFDVCDTGDTAHIKHL